MADVHPLQARITALSEQWYALVGGDHHKDRDCHFYIEKKWSYGQPPVYSVQHDGYFWDELIDVEFPTSDEAHRFLADKLEEMIREESKALSGR